METVGGGQQHGRLDITTQCSKLLADKECLLSYIMLKYSGTSPYLSL